MCIGIYLGVGMKAMMVYLIGVPIFVAQHVYVGGRVGANMYIHGCVGAYLYLGGFAGV